MRSVIPKSMTTLLADEDLIVCAGTVGDVNAGNASEMESIAVAGERAHKMKEGVNRRAGGHDLED